MSLQPFCTFSREMVDLSPVMPLCVRWEHYPRALDTPAPPGMVAPAGACLERLCLEYPQVFPHGHDFYEIAVVLGGRAEHITEASIERIGRGTVVLIPRGQVHGYESFDDFEVLNLFYIAEWLAEDLTDVWRHQPLVRLFMEAALFKTVLGGRVHSFHLSESQLGACLRELGDIAVQQSAPRPNLLFLRACLMKLLVLLHDAYQPDWEGGEAARFRPEVWSVLEEVERRIGLGSPIDVSAMAEACEMSPEHLTREFRRATGMSIMRYFQQRRLQRAVRMLLVPKTSITEVAHLLGFADYAHFRRRFVAYYGTSPGAFRRANGAA